MNAAINNGQQPAATEEDLRLTESSDGSVQVEGFQPLEGEATPPVVSAPTAPPTTHSGEIPDSDEDDDPAVRTAEEATLSAQELEERRARRRQERKDKRERLNQRFAHLEAQILARDRLLDEARAQLAQLQQRGADSDQATIEGRIRQAQDNIRYLQEVIADGTKSQNGEAVARATTALGETQLQLRQLTAAATRMQQRREAPAAAGAPEVDPRMVPLGLQWMKDNESWYNPRGSDPLSTATRAIDNQLAAEGYDPRSSAYWDELTRRTRQLRAGVSGAPSPRSPDPGYNAGASQGKPNRDPVAPGSSGQDGLSVTAGGSGAGATKSFVLSAERVQALKDAGTWDDPKARADAIRRYRLFDAEEAAANRR